MITLLFTWLLIHGASQTLGKQLVPFFSVGEERTSESGPGPVLICVVGLFTLASMAQIWILFLPGHWGWICIVFLAAFSLKRIVCRGFNTWRPFLWIWILAGVVALGLISHRDAITYQHDLIRYASEGGAVKGLAWIHGRFGYLSSWFALTSFFEQPAMGWAGRMDTVLNGYLLGLCLLEGARCGHRWLRGQATTDERFWFLFLTLLLPVPIYLNFPISANPDFPVMVGTGWVARCLFFRRRWMLACWLTACLLAVKLTAFPLLIVVAGVVIRQKWTRLSLYRFGLTSIPVFTLCVVMFRTTGYPVYPVPYTFANVPWALPQDHVRMQKDLVHYQADWFREDRQPALETGRNHPNSWLKTWLRSDRTNFLVLGTCVFALLAVTATGILVHFRNFSWFIFVTGLAGSLAFWIVSPSLRFFWGSLLLIPSVSLASLLPPRIGNIPVKAAQMLMLFWACCLLAPTWIRPTKSEKRIAASLEAGTVRLEPQARWLLPPIVPHLHFDAAKNQAVIPFPERSHNQPGRTSYRRGFWYPPVPMQGGQAIDPDKGWKAGFHRAL